MNTNPWCCDHAVHLCIVVRDMEKTLDNYCALFHLERPPVKWTGTPKDAHVEYRDEPSPAMAKQAFLQFGMLRLELIEPDRTRVPGGNIWTGMATVCIMLRLRLTTCRSL